MLKERGIDAGDFSTMSRTSITGKIALNPIHGRGRDAESRQRLGDCIRQRADRQVSEMKSELVDEAEDDELEEARRDDRAEKWKSRSWGDSCLWIRSF